MSSFLFLRHGETDWNVAGRMQGKSDTLLNAHGREQARQAAASLQEVQIDRIIASPLKRARETAEIVNAILKKPLTLDDRLQERGFGSIEGMTRPEIDTRPEEELFVPHVVQLNGLKLPIGAETPDAFLARVKEGIEENLSRHAGEALLFVAHGEVFRTLCLYLIKEARSAKNAEPYRFYEENGLWRVETMQHEEPALPSFPCIC